MRNRPQEEWGGLIRLGRSIAVDAVLSGAVAMSYTAGLWRMTN